MATVVFNLPVNMSDFSSWLGYVTTATATQISLTNGIYTDLYTGSFTYSNNQPYGNVNGFSEYYNGNLSFTVSNISLDAHVVYNDVQSGQILALIEYVLSGSNNIIRGSSGVDLLVGYGGNNTFYGGGGNDVIYGNATGGSSGVNTVVYSGNFLNYSISANSNGIWSVTDNRPGAPDGNQSIERIDKLQFADGFVSLGAVPSASTFQSVQNLFTTILREDLTYASNNPTEILAGGVQSVNPIYVDAKLLLPYASLVQNGAYSLSQMAGYIANFGSHTTSVATMAYQFFTGSTPSTAGMDYLINPTGSNSNNLNSAYYQSFSDVNRYINFAVNLGKYGAGQATFQSQYGALSLSDATIQAYTTIFGTAPTAAKITGLLTALVPDGLGGQETRAQYFAGYGGDGANGIGTKAAMVGWLLADAISENVGDYALSNHAYLTAVGTGLATFGVNMIGQYDNPSYHYTGG